MHPVARFEPADIREGPRPRRLPDGPPLGRRPAVRRLGAMTRSVPHGSTSSWTTTLLSSIRPPGSCQ